MAHVGNDFTAGLFNDGQPSIFPGNIFIAPGSQYPERDPVDNLPAFYARDSGLALDYRVDSAEEIAAMLLAHDSIGLRGGTLVTNPIPEAHALPREIIDNLIEMAIAEMDAAGVRGKETTPFLLQRISELSGGDSLEANRALVVSNARLAAEIAVAYANRS